MYANSRLLLTLFTLHHRRQPNLLTCFSPTTREAITTKKRTTELANWIEATSHQVILASIRYVAATPRLEFFFKKSAASLPPARSHPKRFADLDLRAPRQRSND